MDIELWFVHFLVFMGVLEHIYRFIDRIKAAVDRGLKFSLLPLCFLKMTVTILPIIAQRAGPCHQSRGANLERAVE